MSVDPVANTSPISKSATASASKQTTGAAALDYNAFLKLLIAQMKNQDPMDPMKSSDYVAQLATFAQVEKSVQMNDRLGSLLISSQLSQADGLIGHKLTSADGTVSGVATAARIGGDGVVAVLGDGRELVVSQGVTVSGG